MLSRTDKIYIQENYPTKEKLEDRLYAIRFDIMNSIDVLLGAIRTLQDESAALSSRSSRHETQLSDYRQRLEILESHVVE